MASDSDLSVAKQVVDLAKDLTGMVHSEAKGAAEKTETKAPETRGGPLLIVGRLYIALTTIMAVTASVSGYLDTKDGKSVTLATSLLRGGVVLSVGFGLVCGIRLLSRLMDKNPMFLSSPTEFSSSVHQAMISQAEPGAGGPPWSANAVPATATVTASAVEGKKDQVLATVTTESKTEPTSGAAQ